MKKYLLFILLVLFPVVMVAQFAVVSTLPANNAKNVALTTTVSVTFNEALDTNAINQNQEDTWFTNIDSVISEGYSVDLKTATVNVVLKPNQSYFLGFIFMKAKSGAVITTPYVFYFTTGADFAPYTVSGTVLSGSTGVLPEGSAVILTTVNIMNDEGKDGPPPFAAWANVNSNGTYTIPNVSNGKYWPLAVKDVNHDGRINPDNGEDVIAFGDSIIVNNASITNLNLTFTKFTPKTFQEVTTIADSLSKNLPADKVLRRISGWNVDTLGRSQSWEFAYTHNNNTMGKGIRVSTGGSNTYTLDQGYIDWIKMLNPITNYLSAASSATVIANVEKAGGKAFRLLPHPDSLEFRIELSIADQKYGWFGPFGFDTSKIYWAVAYTHVYQATQDSSYWVDGKYFLCDFATGAVILTQPTRVKEETPIPERFSLLQNYPNPFNPTTNIRFTIPVSNGTSLKIYDLLGKEVAVLVNEKRDAGEYTIPFNAAHLPSGIYFYQLRSGKFVETKKMILLR
ncbi:MAG: T9SS type A sorting domain-containing protein [Bacteroidota bacterium]|nr:T9SS type A sorting domain-containing protein [Bacteroidota bacterium]